MRFPFISVFLIAFLIPMVTVAQWQLDGAILSGPPPGSVAAPLKILGDGTGGAIAVWAQGGRIVAQRVDASGEVPWGASGTEVCAKLGGDNSNPANCTDGAQGAIFTWIDNRAAPLAIYVQRVNAAGAPQWPANGVAINTTTLNQLPAIVTDGAGGAIIIWTVIPGNDIFAQRVNASGTPQWTAGGVNIGTATTAASNLRTVPDGSGGVFAAWSDSRAGAANTNVYAQRVDASGASLWTIDGVVLCAAVANQSLNSLVEDGSGGAIAAWSDARGGADDIYVQKVTGGGAALWTPADGVAVCAAVGGQVFPVLAGDGFGGAIVVWADGRGASIDIYAQRVNLWGFTQWVLDGVPLCTAAGAQGLIGVGSDLKVVEDGGGGAIAAWVDERVGGLCCRDVYAQRVNGAGVTQWTLDGAPVCAALGMQAGIDIASDGVGGAIAAWLDARPVPGGLVYGQRITYESGLWGRPEAAITSVADVPADQGGRVKVNWEASKWDVLGYTEITHYSVWRATDPFPLSSLAAGILLVDHPSAVGPDFAGSAYWIGPTTSEPYYWEWLGNQAVLNSPGYSFSAATRADSTVEGNADHFFQVVAHTDDPFVFWRSNVETGRSIDNLAPPAPLQFTAQRITTNAPTQEHTLAPVSAPGDVLLHWKAPGAPDLRDYSIYRSNANNVAPTPAFFLTSTEDTTYIDTTAPTGQSWYYVLTANDIHSNSSTATSVVSVGPSTGTGNAPSIRALTVLQNHPNPFTGTTELQIGLPAEADVEIVVYDVAGRVVRKSVLAGQRAGWRSVPFDGRDEKGRSLASGVYFYRVRANGATVTNKMVIAR